MILVASLDRRDWGSCGHVGDFLDPTRMTHTGPGRRAQEGTGQVGGGRACEVGNSNWLVTAELSQDVSVLATRKPMASIAPPNHSREAARRYHGILFQAPPRATRVMQLPIVHADPSLGAPW